MKFRKEKKIDRAVPQTCDTHALIDQLCYSVRSEQQLWEDLIYLAVLRPAFGRGGTARTTRDTAATAAAAAAAAAEVQAWVRV
jgi:hypothetical protein